MAQQQQQFVYGDRFLIKQEPESPSPGTTPPLPTTPSPVCSPPVPPPFFQPLEEREMLQEIEDRRAWMMNVQNYVRQQAQFVDRMRIEREHDVDDELEEQQQSEQEQDDPFLPRLAGAVPPPPAQIILDPVHVENVIYYVNPTAPGEPLEPEDMRRMGEEVRRYFALPREVRLLREGRQQQQVREDLQQHQQNDLLRQDDDHDEQQQQDPRPANNMNNYYNNNIQNNNNNNNMNNNNNNINNNYQVDIELLNARRLRRPSPNNRRRPVGAEQGAREAVVEEEREVPALGDQVVPDASLNDRRRRPCRLPLNNHHHHFNRRKTRRTTARDPQTTPTAVFNIRRVETVYQNCTQHYHHEHYSAAGQHAPRLRRPR